jgi:hypothetical protein
MSDNVPVILLPLSLSNRCWPIPAVWCTHHAFTRRIQLPDAGCHLTVPMTHTWLCCRAAALKFYLYSQLEYITAAMLSKYVPTGEQV